MKVLKKMELMERLAKEIIKQLANKEKITTFLNELGIGTSSKSLYANDLTTYVLGRLEGTDDDKLQKMAQEELGMNIDDLLT